jgi:hypothetical protein
VDHLLGTGAVDQENNAQSQKRATGDAAIDRETGNVIGHGETSAETNVV